MFKILAFGLKFFTRLDATHALRAYEHRAYITGLVCFTSASIRWWFHFSPPPKTIQCQTTRIMGIQSESPLKVTDGERTDRLNNL